MIRSKRQAGKQAVKAMQDCKQRSCGVKMMLPFSQASMDDSRGQALRCQIQLFTEPSESFCIQSLPACLAGLHFPGCSLVICSKDPGWDLEASQSAVLLPAVCSLAQLLLYRLPPAGILSNSKPWARKG